MESAIVKSQNEEFIKHNVKFTDTLSGLSLKYRVTVDEIKSTNKINKDEEMWTRFHIMIPFRGQELPQPDEKEKKKYRQDMKNRLAKRFSRATNCSTYEARYYLKMNAWCYDEAISEIKSDLLWETKHPPRIPLSQKC